MSGVSMSKARVVELRDSNRDQREAIIHHTEKLGELQEALGDQHKRLARVEAWLATMSALPWWRRLRWLFTGR